MVKRILIVTLVIALALPMVTVAGEVKGGDIVNKTFHGFVTDNETKAAILGANIYAFDEDYKEYYTTKTDNLGHYSFDVDSAGFYYLYASKEGYSRLAAISLMGINDESTVNFTLDPIITDFYVYGVVEGAGTGEPLADVHITLFKMVAPGIFTPRDDRMTNSSGEFHYNLTNGTYRLDFSKEGYFTSQFTFDEGLHLNMGLNRFEYGVRGQVIDEQGNPMEGVTLTLENDDYKYFDTSDDQGNYEIRVPYGGKFILTAYSDGHRPSFTPVNVQGDLEEIDPIMKDAYVPLIYRILYTILSLLGLM